MPIVVSLSSGKIKIYDSNMTPQQSVRNAWLADSKDNNWWGYKAPAEYQEFKQGRWFCSCGDWSSPVDVDLVLPNWLYKFGNPESKQYGSPDFDCGEKSGPQWISYYTGADKTNLLYLLDDSILRDPSQTKNAVEKSKIDRLIPASVFLFVVKVDIPSRKFTVRIKSSSFNGFGFPIQKEPNT